MLLTTDASDAAQALAAGHLAALPTETVYGLGARADLPRSVARVYAVKGRPADHPLIVHVADADAAWAWADRVPEYAESLAAGFWPGPLTLVLPRSVRAGDFITGGQDTVAIRVPSHPVMRAVLQRLSEVTGDRAVGIAAPSANRFGRVSPTTSAHVRSELEPFLSDDDVLLDGGASDVGLESTIVDCTGPDPVVLRPGQVSAADIETVTGRRLAAQSDVRAPGTLASHYAPDAGVMLVTKTDDLPATSPDQQARMGLLALADVETPPGLVRLSAPETVADYARVLYSALREADALELTSVVAVLPPAEGVGAAVIDRLTRAATR